MNEEEIMSKVANGLVKDGEESTNELRQATTEEIIGAELRDHAERSIEYKKLIKEAKTDVKRKYYKKKLKKNNESAFQLLLALEELSRLKKTEELESEAPVEEQNDDGSE